MLAKLWYVAAKDLLLVTKDRGALILMFAVPLLLMAVLGSVLSGFGNGSRVTAILPVVNHDGGPSSTAMIAALRKVPGLTIQLRTDENSLKKAVRNGDRPGLLILPAGFSTALSTARPAARLNYYNVISNTGADAQLARDAVQVVVQSLAFRSLVTQTALRAQRASGGRSSVALANQLGAAAARQLETAPPVSIHTVNATGKTYRAQDNTVPGYALMFALFAVTASAGTLLAEREAGTLKRLLIAPLPPFALLGGKLLAQYIQTVIQLTVLLGLGVLLFKVNLGPSVPALALLILGTAFAATGVGMILVSLVRSRAQLGPITTLVVLSFSALGGSWWPISIEPHWMQDVARITVTAWAMDGFNGLMIFDKSFMQVLPNIAALFAYGLICFAIARRTFRLREV